MIDAAETTRAGRGWGSALLVVTAGLLGLLGVAVSAAASHAGGGSIGATAGTFLLLHATATLGIVALARQARRPIVLLVSGWVLAVGTLLFSGDLALASLAGLRPFPPAAPIGGSLLMLGWLGVVLGGLFSRPLM